jgi:hypothetical protein
MPDKRQHGGKRPGAGRKPGKDYPARVNVRVTHEQFNHLERCATKEDIAIADYVRRLVDLDMLLPENKMVIAVNPATATALAQPRPAGDGDGRELDY